MLAPSHFREIAELLLKKFSRLVWSGGSRKVTAIFVLSKANSILVKPVIMKHPTVYSLSIVAVALFLWTSQHQPVPWVLARFRSWFARMKARLPSRMRLLNGSCCTLYAAQENILKSQGASDSFDSVSPQLQFSGFREEEAAELEAQRRTKSKSSASRRNLGQVKLPRVNYMCSTSRWAIRLISASGADPITRSHSIPIGVPAKILFSLL